MTELRPDKRGRQRPAKYYPRDLEFARPPSPKVVEFLVVGRNEIGALSKILQIVSKHDVNLLSLNASSRPVDSEESFIITFFGDFSKSDTVMEALEKEIRTLGFVREVSWVKMSQSIYDHFLFPVTMFNNVRFIALRADPLMNIERRVIEKLGSTGASIMFQEGVAYAHETTAQQKSTFPNVHPDVLLENNLEGFRASGWGIFEHKKTKNTFEISVTNLPFSKREEGSFQSYLLNGIMVGMIEKLYSKNYKVTASRYDSSKDTLFLTIDEA